MEFIFSIFTFILGTIVGSFLNVIIYRYGTNNSMLVGRSMCFSCKKTLSWYELIPIISAIIQRGKCRGCKEKISIQYPLVEILTGLLFMSVLSVGYSHIVSVVRLIIMSLLVIIAVYDFWHKIIPDFFVFSFIILSGFLLVWSPELNSFEFPVLLDVVAGPVLFAPFAGLWYFSGGRAMGFGDAKLAWGIGWFLGLGAGVSAIILSFWTGAIFGLFVILFAKISKNKNIKLFSKLKMFTIKSEIPFGPFMILGIFLVFFFHVNPMSLVQIF